MNNKNIEILFLKFEKIRSIIELISTTFLTKNYLISKIKIF